MIYFSSYTDIEPAFSNSRFVVWKATMTGAPDATGTGLTDTRVTKAAKRKRGHGAGSAAEDAKAKKKKGSAQ